MTTIYHYIIPRSTRHSGLKSACGISDIRAKFGHDGYFYPNTQSINCKECRESETFSQDLFIFELKCDADIIKYLKHKRVYA